MSDPIKIDFAIPDRFRAGVEEASAGNVADHCPGAVLNGRRVTCSGVVYMRTENEITYRYALCIACHEREQKQRDEAKTRAESNEPRGAMKVPGK